MSKLIGVFIGIIVSISLAFQLWQVHVFINAGPRFTAKDGQELCEFTNTIAEHSIGFKQSGLPLLDCEKYLRGVK